MKRSVDRILTTHSGSFNRPQLLRDLLRARAAGEPFDEDLFRRTKREAVADVVRAQIEHGLDIVNDGEQPRIMFSSYMLDRLDGFMPIESSVQPRERQYPAGGWNALEMAAFPEFWNRYYSSDYYADENRPPRAAPKVCVDKITYTGHAALQEDLDNLAAALAGKQYEEAFVSAASVNPNQKNEYYETEEDYIFALADAQRVEYEAIVAAGFLVQIDDPAFTRVVPSEQLQAEQRRRELKIEALNHALRNIPQDRVRLHICFGPSLNPKVYDPDLKEVFEVVLRINAGAYSFEASNPRHFHEYHIWEEMKLPEGKILLPGMVSHGANIVERPEYIAELTVNYAQRVGRENVIVSNDCGFSSIATDYPEIDPRVGWAKIKAMAKGAMLATERLW